MLRCSTKFDTRGECVEKLGDRREEEVGGQPRSEERRNGGTSAGGREEAGDIGKRERRSGGQ